jgi:hypothetical protein
VKGYKVVEGDLAGWTLQHVPFGCRPVVSQNKQRKKLPTNRKKTVKKSWHYVYSPSKSYFIFYLAFYYSGSGL